MTPQEKAALIIAAMTPQQKAARVIGAIQMGDPPERPLSPIMRAVMAESIRAAVDLVLPEEQNIYTDPALRRMITRAQFLAIAAELEGPTNG